MEIHTIAVCNPVTYHHLIYGIYNVVHLFAGNVAVVIHIVQTEGPCIHIQQVNINDSIIKCDTYSAVSHPSCLLMLWRVHE